MFYFLSPVVLSHLKETDMHVQRRSRKSVAKKLKAPTKKGKKSATITHEKSPFKGKYHVCYEML